MAPTTARRYMRMFRELRSRAAAAAAAPPDTNRNWPPRWEKVPEGIGAGIEGGRNRAVGGGNGGEWGREREPERCRSREPRTKDREAKERRTREKGGDFGNGGISGFGRN